MCNEKRNVQKALCGFFPLHKFYLHMTDSIFTYISRRNSAHSFIDSWSFQFAL